MIRRICLCLAMTGTGVHDGHPENILVQTYCTLYITCDTFVPCLSIIFYIAYINTRRYMYSLHTGTFLSCRSRTLYSLQPLSPVSILEIVSARSDRILLCAMQKGFMAYIITYMHAYTFMYNGGCMMTLRPLRLKKREGTKVWNLRLPFIKASSHSSHGIPGFCKALFRKCQYDTATSLGSRTNAITRRQESGSIRIGACVCITRGDLTDCTSDGLR